MSRLPLIISLFTCAINVATAVWVYHRVNTSILADNRAEVKVVNAKQPILASAIVQRELGYGGQQLSTVYAQSVRGKAYLVEVEGARYVLYSPGLPPMVQGTVVRGWFQHISVQDDAVQGKPTFLAPLEVISITDPAVERAGVAIANPLKLPPLSP